MSVGLTKTQAAYASIRADIESGASRPGQRLRLSALQAQLEISPTPIREALRMLQADGLITNLPHQGMTVTSYAPEEVEEVYALREAIEPLAASYAALRSTPKSTERMTSLHEQMVAAVRSGDHAKAGELGGEWHEAVAEASGARLVDDFFRRLRVVLPLKTMWLASRAGLSIHEHGEINEAIAAGDAAGASAAMSRHLDRGRQQATSRFGAPTEPRRSD